jgi:hypothetical protein
MRKILTFLLVVLLFTVAYSAEKTNNEEGGHLKKTAVQDQAQIDVNQIRAWMTNRGSFFRNPFTGNSGLEFPIESNTYAIYASGLWVGGLVPTSGGGKDIRVAVAEYSYEYNPGTMNSDGSWNEPEDGRFRMYKITRADYIAATDGDNTTYPGDDWVDWPVEDGAPTQNWVDSEGTSHTIPLLMGDQTLWTVYNDADPNVHVNMGSGPLGIEIGQLSWGYNKPGALGNTIFTKFTVINKSGADIDSCYLSVWSDPDLGDSGDDFVGCDTTLNMGFCYNATNVDGEYGSAPPAVGYDYFQGPIVASEGDTAIFNFGKKADYKNLPMSSFIYYNNADVNNGNPFTPQDVYHYMQALWRDGTPITFGGDGTSGSERAYFMFPSDPENPTGNVWLDVAEGDRRFLQNAGPFTMANGDTQEVVIGVVAARGGNNLNSVSLLKNYDAFAQKAFDINFELPNGPEPPLVEATMLDREVVITWNAATEEYNEPYLAIPETDSEGNPLQRDYRFQGYLVYQYPSNAYENGALLATYDLPGDDIKTIWDFTLDNTVGTYVNKPIVKGTDSGIKRYIRITEDKLTNLSSKLLINGRNYYFGVQAYGYTPDGPDGEKIIFSPIAKIEAQPQGPAIGTRYYAEFSDSIKVTKNGISDGFTIVQVVDPSKLTGLDYTVTFEVDTVAHDGSFMWNLERSDGVSVLNDITYQGGDSLDEKFSVTDGMIVKVMGPPFATKAVYETDAEGTVLDNSVSILAPSLGTTGYLLSNRAGAVNQPPYARDWDRFGYWGMDDFEIDFSDSSLTYDYLGEEIHKDSTSGEPTYAPFAVYRYHFLSGEKQRLVAGYWDRDGDGTWNMPMINDTTYMWEGPIYHKPSYEPIYCWVGNEADGSFKGYDPAEEATYISENSLSTTFNTTWGGGTGYEHYPIITAMLFTMYLENATPPYGNKVRFDTNKPNSDAVTFTFTAPKAYTTDKSDQIADLSQLNVYPNPYYGAHAGEVTQFDQWVRFTHLPPTCTIRIFNLAGELVRKIERADAALPIEAWNLQNTHGLPVASGIYVYHVEAPGIGEKVGKVTILAPQQRLNTY